ncbi:MAG: excinuclease ABC subunit UvrC [Clostridia bacterium]|nr:excinuclease ABC subunit UvrC [Clostridia bacterium]
MTRQQLLERVKNELPETSGVYIMKNIDDEVIYVGKAKALKRRVKSYFDDTPKTQKTYALVSNIDHFDYILTNSELDAFSLESNLIKKYKPKYNILLKDDKSFPYLKIDMKEKFPRLQIVRRPKSEQGVLLFGPYVTGTRISELVALIKSAYPIRWCNKNFEGKNSQSKPCLYGEIGKCLAPCVSVENETKYMEMLDNVVAFLNGKTSDIKKKLKKKMDEQAEVLNFEEALITRNQIKMIEAIDNELITSLASDADIDVFAVAEQDEFYNVNVMMLRKGKNVGQVNYPLPDAVGTKTEILMSFISGFYKDSATLPKEIVVGAFGEDEREMLAGFILSNLNKAVKITIPKIGIKTELVKNAEKNAEEFLRNSKARIEKKQKATIEALENLKKLLGLKRLKRMECYDISHISGEFAVASMVVFEDGEPAYKEYRKFKIKTVQGNDDYASMTEVLTRRLTDMIECKENFSKRPDLIVLDGGFGQLHSVQKVLEKLDVDIPLISLAEKNEDICTTFSNEPVSLQKSNNVVKLLQRIRDEAHRFAITFHRQLRGKSLKASLDEIEGVGAQKAHALIKHFKSVEGISKASKKDLMKVERIGEALANVIYLFYHGENN